MESIRIDENNAKISQIKAKRIERKKGTEVSK
jgi:hypothetical protein